MDYSNSAIPAQPWHPKMDELKYLISSDTFHPNSALINCYERVTDHVSPHRDKDLFDGNNFVCTVSLGGTRLFRFTPYTGVISAKMKLPEGLELPKKIETYLNEGDVVYMYGNSNYYFQHEIAKYRKTIDKYVFKPRYSCTFRVIEDGSNPIFDTVDEMKEHYSSHV
jgi:alkylated DNA repair dioxygenase AlkB